VCRQQRPKGFAFLEFDNPSAASTAIQQMNGFQLMGRTIKVLLAGVLPAGFVFLYLGLIP
jgi:RNA recognition motif-containing protein